MLNEGFQLRRNLDQNAFQVPMTHPDVKKPGRNAGYRVRLDQDGRPSFVEELTAETMASLWCHREGRIMYAGTIPPLLFLPGVSRLLVLRTGRATR